MSYHYTWRPASSEKQYSQGGLADHDNSEFVDGPQEAQGNMYRLHGASVNTANCSPPVDDAQPMAADGVFADEARDAEIAPMQHAVPSCHAYPSRLQRNTNIDRPRIMPIQDQQLLSLGQWATLECQAGDLPTGSADDLISQAGAYPYACDRLRQQTLSKVEYAVPVIASAPFRKDITRNNQGCPTESSNSLSDRSTNEKREDRRRAKHAKGRATARCAGEDRQSRPLPRHPDSPRDSEGETKPGIPVTAGMLPAPGWPDVSWIPAQSGLIASGSLAVCPSCIAEDEEDLVERPRHELDDKR